MPNVLVVRQNDLVHIQWTGSDANPNGNDGEGRRMTGTDMLPRHSFVGILASNMQSISHICLGGFVSEICTLARAAYKSVDHLVLRLVFVSPACFPCTTSCVCR